MSVEVTEDKLEKFAKALKILSRHEVMVGVPEDKTGRENDGGKTNAEIAYVNEFGKGVPKRAFIEPGISEIKDKIAKRLELCASDALDGKSESVIMAHMHSVGLMAQNAVRQAITEGPFEPLAEKTLKNRKNRKIAPRQGEKPLIDTGQLRQSLTYVVREVKE